jgi:alkanesulfonate monooxygenase SsuD/methylene tetrahydromethanopterin reductase-like flavin-dependent oxidoreductase (luciferase family)
VVSATDKDTYREQVAEFERACAEVGRDPASLRRTWFGGCLCAPTKSEVEALRRYPGNPYHSFIGTPAQVIQQMRPFVDLGIDYFMLQNDGFPNQTTLEMLIQEVLPALNS